jgi:hypothetical protein
MRARAPIVTVHALRRYAERVIGIEGLDESDPLAVIELEFDHKVDIVSIKRQIADTVRRGVAAGAPIVISNGVRYTMEGNVVVTVKRQYGRRTRPRWPRVDRNNDFG